jgi:hypothetical protein
MESDRFLTGAQQALPFFFASGNGALMTAEIWIFLSDFRHQPAICIFWITRDAYPPVLLVINRALESIG